MTPTDEQQLLEFVRYLAKHALLYGIPQDQPDRLYGRSLHEMITDQPDGFATE